MSGYSGGGRHPGWNSKRREVQAVDVLEVAVDALTRWRKAGSRVTVVAIDGYGASGKTTIAGSLCARIVFSLVHADDFFKPARQRPADPARNESSHAPSPPVGERGRDLADYYDVARLRSEALEPLRAGHEALFQRFDWDSGALSSVETRVAPHELVVLEGVYSAAPELADLVDKAIYVDTPEPERLRRLAELVAPEEWDSGWLRAEKDYFDTTRPADSFDLVISGAGLDVRGGERS
jgi:uridine kinase